MQQLLRLVLVFSIGCLSLSAQNVGIGTTTPGQRLDIIGNLQFSGALMPNGAAGTAGQVLVSAGPGAPPTWAAAPSNAICPGATVNRIAKFSSTTEACNSQIVDDGTEVYINSPFFTPNYLFTVDALAGTSGMGAVGNTGYGVFGLGAFSGVGGESPIDDPASSGAIGFGSAADATGVIGMGGNFATITTLIWNGNNAGSGLVGNGRLNGAYARADAVGGVGVVGTADGETGNGGVGVFGTATGNDGIGLFARANDLNAIGTYTESLGSGGTGVLALAEAQGNAASAQEDAVFAQVQGVGNSPAAGVTGVDAVGGANSVAIFAAGDFLATGAKAFVIDHPLDPQNKLLRHYCHEGNEPLNIYAGSVTTDATGEAVVSFPAYVGAVNADFRYQLTVVGSFSRAMVKTTFQNDQFVIATEDPNVEVQWMLIGRRNDPYVQQFLKPVEQTKPTAWQGKYLNPKAYGQPASQGALYKTSPNPVVTPQPHSLPSGTPAAAVSSTPIIK